jgi:hypothetical protein
MADEPRERAGQESPDYEPPQAEELASEDPEVTGTGLNGTPQDDSTIPSDHALKTGFAEVNVDAVLAAVRKVHNEERR